MAGPPEKSELPLTDMAMAIALVLGLAIAYTSLAPLLSGARLAHRLRLRPSTAFLDARPPHPPLTLTTSSPLAPTPDLDHSRLAAADPSQWLPAASSPKKKKSPAAKRT